MALNKFRTPRSRHGAGWGVGCPQPTGRHRRGVVRTLCGGKSVSWQWRLDLAGSMVRFAVPAVGIPLAEPLMSLVDSIAVAQVRLTYPCGPCYLPQLLVALHLSLVAQAQAAGSRELAALGPNTLIFSFSTYVFTALSIATIRYLTL